MMERWRGKVAVVTGAASGIGAAISRRLLDAGLQVVGLDPQLEKMQQICGIHPIQCDISKEDQLEAAFRHVEQQFGGLQVLVNNAGVIDYTPIIDSDRTSFEKILNINVGAAASCISKAVRSMRNQKVEGHIFNINSVLGHVIPEGPLSQEEGANGFNLYPASKHAGIAMTHTVRGELTRAKLPIKITSISPGLVKTDISKQSEVMKNLFENILCLEPDDIADALMYALGTRPEVQVTELTVRRIGEVV